MKTFLNRGLLLAGIIVVGNAAGWAQTMKAKIPFDFHAANADMPAGEYYVRQLNAGSPILVLSNRAASKTVMVMPLARMIESAHSDPRMIFHCAQSRCSLAEVWGGTFDGYKLSEPKQTPGERERLSVVYFERKPSGK